MSEGNPPFFLSVKPRSALLSDMHNPSINKSTMNIEIFRKKIERMMTDDEIEFNSDEMWNTPFNEMITKDLSWCLHHICPFLIIALAIDVALIFTTPMEIAGYPWFQLFKEPLSLCIAWLISRKLLHIL